MATKAEKFVPLAIPRAAALVAKIADLQRDAAKLASEYDAQGGSGMTGLADINWTSYGITQGEFTAGLAALTANINGVTLETLLTGKKLAALVVLANANG